MGKVDLVVNVPVDFDVQYADVVEGQYGPQLQLKGQTPDDPKAILWLDLAHADEALQASGALRGVLEFPEDLPPKGYSVRNQFRATALTITRAQRAGEKNPHLAIAVRGKGATTRAASAAAQTAGAAPAAAARSGSDAAAKPSTLGLYLECLDAVVRHVKPRLEGAGVEVTDQGLCAAAATLFINRQREGR